MTIRLSLSGMTKVYPGIVALQDVDLSIRGGEIVGLVGENGAGKSTLMKILGGAIRPDGGNIRIDDETLSGLTPSEAQAHKIAFVHQELNPFTNLDVAGNVLLGREIASGWLQLLDRRAMAERVQPILDMLGAGFTAKDPAAALSIADQQLVEIARALSMDARLIILDEPTSSLTMSESRRLLDVLRRLRGRGVAILFVSHRLSEVEALADRVIVLRDGRKVGELASGEIDRDTMVQMMIGRDVGHFYEKSDHTVRAAALELRGIRTPAHVDAIVDLTVHAGEILGLAGLIGAGRTELARVIFGIDPPLEGEVLVGGKLLPPGSVAAAIEHGLCLVPESRKEQGLFLDFAIVDNITMPSLSRVSTHGFVNKARETALAEASRRQLAIKTTSVSRPVAELSGGNQQKVVLAKWLTTQPRVVIFDEPTRGIDVGSKAEIYRLMQDLTRNGAGILMISSDMEEVIGVSDRVAVMCQGEITGILRPDELTEEAILRFAVG